MFRAALASIVGSALFVAPVYAAFINDSEVIDIEYIGGTERSESGFTAPPVPPPPEGGGKVIIFNDASPAAPEAPQIPVVVVSSSANLPPSLPAAPAPNTGAGAAPDSGAAPAASSEISSEDIIDILVASNAVAALGSYKGGGGILGAAGLRFNGNRLRDALRGDGIYRLEFPGGGSFTELGSGGKFTQSDFAIMVSRAALEDEGIDEVSYWRGTLTVRYKALGRLFGFLPLRYQLTTVVSVSKTPSISLHFPWYSFILAKGISAKKLQANIAGAVAAVSGEGSDSYDSATRIFTAVADTLTHELGGF